MTTEQLKEMVNESLPWPRPRKLKVREYRVDFDYNSNPELPWIISKRGFIARKESLEEVFATIQLYTPSIVYPDEIQCL